MMLLRMLLLYQGKVRVLKKKYSPTVVTASLMMKVTIEWKKIKNVEKREEIVEPKVGSKNGFKNCG